MLLVFVALPLTNCGELTLAEFTVIFESVLLIFVVLPLTYCGDFNELTSAEFTVIFESVLWLIFVVLPLTNCRDFDVVITLVELIVGFETVLTNSVGLSLTNTEDFDALLLFKAILLISLANCGDLTTLTVFRMHSVGFPLVELTELVGEISAAPVCAKSENGTKEVLIYNYSPGK